MMAIDQGQLVNFEAYLSEGGIIVPGSIRRGHNCITFAGMKWLADLVTWSDLTGADDVPVTQERIYWLGVGDGSQPELPHITTLKSARIYTSTYYFKAIDPATMITRPVVTALKISNVYATGELPNPFSFSEAGLVVDTNPPAKNQSSSSLEIAFYKRIDPALSKTSSQTLTVNWEFRF